MGSTYACGQSTHLDGEYNFTRACDAVQYQEPKGSREICSHSVFGYAFPVKDPTPFLSEKTPAVSERPDILGDHGHPHDVVLDGDVSEALCRTSQVRAKSRLRTTVEVREVLPIAKGFTRCALGVSVVPGASRIMMPFVPKYCGIISGDPARMLELSNTHHSARGSTTEPLPPVRLRLPGSPSRFRVSPWVLEWIPS